jgi:hypothetical protein
VITSAGSKAFWRNRYGVSVSSSASDTTCREARVVVSQQPPAATHGLRSQSGESITLAKLRPKAESRRGLNSHSSKGLSAAIPQSPNTSEQWQFKPPDAVDGTSGVFDHVRTIRFRPKNSSELFGGRRPSVLPAKYRWARLATRTEMHGGII